MQQASCSAVQVTEESRRVSLTGTHTLTPYPYLLSGVNQRGRATRESPAAAAAKKSGQIRVAAASKAELIRTSTDGNLARNREASASKWLSDLLFRIPMTEPSKSLGTHSHSAAAAAQPTKPRRCRRLSSCPILQRERPPGIGLTPRQNIQSIRRFVRHPALADT